MKLEQNNAQKNPSYELKSLKSALKCHESVWHSKHTADWSLYSMYLHSSLYYYGGRCKAIKPWRTWPCDRCLEIAQHPLTTAQLSLWCPGWVLELPVRPLWRTSPHSLPHLQRPSGDEEEGTRQRYNRAVISTVPCLKTLCGTDDKRSFAKLIAGKFQPLSIFKRPFIICLFKAI